MKNLIKEINDNKLLSNSKISEDFKRGFNRGLDLSQEIINQYNIITAPKSILLSEIISRLKDFDCYTSEIYIERENSDTFIEVFYYNYKDCECGGWVKITDGTICDLSFGNHSYHKWLYTLWIAGTHIVDDLVGDE